MGVHGLWELLAPVGRRVSVEALGNKKLAIDASIWIVHFIKAMRDERGDMIRNAHLLGFFRRICKLLFLRIKPIFVFDGGTPALKRRTVMARRRQRERAQSRMRKTAEKLLLNHLRSKRLEELATEGRDSEQNKEAGKNKGIGDLEGTTRFAASSSKEQGNYVGTSQQLDEQLDDEDSEDDGNEQIVFPMEQGKLDHAVLASLPPSMQLDLLVQMREHRVAENRQKFQNVAKAPLSFSQLQIEAYLKTVAFRRAIDEVQKAASGKGIGGVPAARIASESNREFIFSSALDGESRLLNMAGNTKNDSPGMSSAAVDMNASSVSNIQIHNNKENAETSANSIDGSAVVTNTPVQTYIDERGTRRVSKVRGMGVRMTRDLQWNLYLMKDKENQSSKQKLPFIENEIEEQSNNEPDLELNEALLEESRFEISSTSSSPVSTSKVPVVSHGLMVTIEDNGVSVESSDDDMFRELVLAEPILGGTPCTSGQPSGDKDGMVEELCPHENQFVSKESLEREDGTTEQVNTAVEKHGDGYGSVQDKQNGSSRLYMESRPKAGVFQSPPEGNNQVNEDDVIWEDGIDISDMPADDINQMQGDRDRSVVDKENAGPLGGDDVIREDGTDTSGMPAVNINHLTDTIVEKNGDGYGPVQDKQNGSLLLCIESGANVGVFESAFEGNNEIIEDVIWEDGSKVSGMPATNVDERHGERDGSVEGKQNTSPFGEHDVIWEDGTNMSGMPAANLSQMLVEDKQIASSLGEIEGSLEDSKFRGKVGVFPPSLDYSNQVDNISDMPAVNMNGSVGGLSWRTSASEEAEIEEAIRLSLEAYGQQPSAKHSGGPAVREVGTCFNSDVSVLDALPNNYGEKDGKYCSQTGDSSMPFSRELRGEEKGCSDPDRLTKEGTGRTLAEGSFNASLICEAETFNLQTETEEMLKQEMELSRFHEMEAERDAIQEEVNVGRELLMKEKLELQASQKKNERDAESVTSEMFADCQELLQMFGIPYIIAPMEAEAQCAFLDSIKLVDGVVTDDSDVFLFGGRSVYKNIFDGHKYVETYYMKDVESELGLSQEKLIRMALLLGSDYTEGVSGIGIVNAIEVVGAFPEDDGLMKFKEWIDSPDLSLLQKTSSHGSKSGKLKEKDESEVMSDLGGCIMTDKKQTFMAKHRAVSKNWVVPESFPSETVIAAYASPQVDKSTESFAWGRPDLEALRRFCFEKFGWIKEKADELLLPVLKEYDRRETQLRLDAFYSFNQRFAKVRSHRIQKALTGITGRQSFEIMDLPSENPSIKKIKTRSKPKSLQKEPRQKKAKRDSTDKNFNEASSMKPKERKQNASARKKTKRDIVNLDSEDTDQVAEARSMSRRRSTRKRKDVNYATDSSEDVAPEIEALETISRKGVDTNMATNRPGSESQSREAISILRDGSNFVPDDNKAESSACRRSIPDRDSAVNTSMQSDPPYSIENVDDDVAHGSFVQDEADYLVARGGFVQPEADYLLAGGGFVEDEASTKVANSSPPLSPCDPATKDLSPSCPTSSNIESVGQPEADYFFAGGGFVQDEASTEVACNTTLGTCDPATKDSSPSCPTPNDRGEFIKVLPHEGNSGMGLRALPYFRRKRRK